MKISYKKTGFIKFKMYIINSTLKSFIISWISIIIKTCRAMPIKDMKNRNLNVKIKLYNVFGLLSDLFSE